MKSLLEKFDIYPYIREGDWVRTPAVVRRTGHVFYDLGVAECKLCSNCNLENCEECKEEVIPASWQFSDDIWTLRKLLKAAGCTENELQEYEMNHPLRDEKKPTVEDLKEKRPDLYTRMFEVDKRLWAKFDQIAKRVSSFTELRHLAFVGELKEDIPHVNNQMNAWWEFYRKDNAIFGDKRENTDLNKLKAF